MGEHDRQYCVVRVMNRKGTMIQGLMLMLTYSITSEHMF